MKIFTNKLRRYFDTFDYKNSRKKFKKLKLTLILSEKSYF